MIYIEVKFGTINGNAIDVDSALSLNSTNPVQNKIVTAALNTLQQQITDLSSQIPKEVVAVPTYDDLEDIENPSTEVVYITSDTGDLYIYDGSEFVLSTDEEFDGTIYVTNIDELIDMTLESGKSYAVVCAYQEEGVNKSESYTLNVSQSGRTLISKDGWAIIDDDEWNWSRYSYEGHTHAVADISGLAAAIQSATINKQDKTDNSLDTTDKTIVGAINSLLAQMTGIIHAYTIDFQDARTIVQMRNLKGAIALKKIVCDNVSTLKVSVNGTLNTLTLTNGVWTGNLAIADNALLVWNIGRTTEGSIAEINVQYQYNS